ncbi:hypothetical protein BSKO_13615 [Bryopsis sp. KO-2023]|nr:hypothetical protein BSKO_13615 [Bryopsis sp. KO-2023]
MRAAHTIVLFALIYQAVALNPFQSKVSDDSGAIQQPFRGESRDDDDGSGGLKQPFRRRPRDCGGLKQKCCPNSQCGGALKCLTPGDNNWVGMTQRCLPPKVRGRCGTDGLSCCVKRCIGGLTCAGGRMCRKPADRIVPDTTVTGGTTAQLSGWVKVQVLARGGKCFVRVTGDINASVMTFGEGTFGETFGDLSALGECEEGASGVAIGYIRADVMGTAFLTEDGECVTESTSDIQLGGKIKGTGITLTFDGNAGAEVGCLKRRLLLADFL